MPPTRVGTRMPSALATEGGVGGHLEPSELRTPGFGPDDSDDLRLRYVVLRLREREIRQQYAHVARTRRHDSSDTAEGRLHWMDLAEVLNRYGSRSTHFIIEHDLQEGSRSDTLYVGTLHDRGGAAAITWAPLSDCE